MIDKIMNSPNQKCRAISAAPAFSRKHQNAYLRHIEIENDNKKLLHSMGQIMQSNYKSAVKTAISNRKCLHFKIKSALIIYLKLSGIKI